ncbi:MAG: 4-hydroxybutyrate CoA-transferase [Acidimicrobiia bacterium]|nr:4-hydroxybutyrate CoA-transferase [Acidimicrobiia bacterium]
MAEAVAAVRPTDTVTIPLGPGQPTGFLHALGERDDWVDLNVLGGLLVDLYPLFTNPNVHYRSGFFSLSERILVESGADVQFVPADFRRFGPVAEKSASRVVATLAALPDASGFMSLGLHAGAMTEELARVIADPNRVLIVETNPNCPRTLGLPPEHPHHVHVDDADILVESDRPMFVLADAEPTDVERAIARQASEYIHDGSTLQTGIGGIPSAIAGLLAEGDGGDYGVHSEMFTTGLMKLHLAGKVTNRHKGIFEGSSISTFAAGTQELNRWLDGNEEVRFLPVSVVNSPETIAANVNMVTINGALSVDLYSQAVADTIAGKQYSGIGGHEDFTAASGFQLEDRALLCMPSTMTVDEEMRSRILPALPEGWVVTTPRHQVDVVITEYGAAELRACTVRERALALAEIAHPDFRDELRKRAALLG